MIDASVVGREYPPYTVEVEKGHIASFAEAIGDASPAFQPVAGDALVAPPTFVTAFRSGEFTILQDLEVDLRKLLHGEQQYEYRRRVRPGDVLTCTPRIDAVKSKETKKGSMVFLTTELSMTDASGEVVCVARSTVAIRG